MSLKDATINASITVRFINFTEFIKKVPVQTMPVDHTLAQFNRQTKGFQPFFEYTEPRHISDSMEASYQKSFLMLTQGEFNQLCKRDLISQAEHKQVWKEPIQETIEKMCVEHVMEFGTGEWIVKLGSRMYMIADPNDFMIYVNNKGFALAVFKMVSARIYHVSRLTEKQAIQLTTAALNHTLLVEGADTHRLIEEGTPTLKSLSGEDLILFKSNLAKLGPNEKIDLSPKFTEAQLEEMEKTSAEVKKLLLQFEENLKTE